MPLIAGVPLFLLAVVMLVYVPGKLLLQWLKPGVSPLEDVTLSLVLGLIVSGCVYWLVAFCGLQRFYFLWPSLASALFVFLHRHSLRALAASRLHGVEPQPGSIRHSRWRREHLALSIVILLGVLTLAVLPQYYSNFTSGPQGTLTVNHLNDPVFHLAIANELTHCVPPQVPFCAGLPLNYHYGMDLCVAMFAQATGLDTRDLALRFVATLLVALSMLTVFCFSRTWLGSGGFGALTTLLVFFGEDFSFVPGLMFGWKSDWSLAFGVPTVWSLFAANPMLPGVGLLFASLFCLLRFTRDRRRAWLFLSALFLATLVEIKVFSAVHALLSLGITSVLYLVVFRDTRLFKVAALTGVLALPLLLAALSHNDQGAQIRATLDPWPYVSDAMEKLGMAGRFTSALAFACMALPIYLVGCLGLRVIAIPRIIKGVVRPDRENCLRFMLALFVILGIVCTLTLRIAPKDLENSSDNSIWLFVQSKYVAWVFAVEALRELYRHLVSRGLGPGYVGAAIALSTIALTVPSAAQHFMKLRAKRNLIWDGEVLATADFIMEHARPGEVVLPVGALLFPVLTMTKCRVSTSYLDNYLVPLSDSTRRRVAAEEFWAAWGRGEVRSDLVRELAPDYIAAETGASAPFLTDDPAMSRRAPLPPELVPVYKNTDYVVFRVQRNR